MRIFLLFFFIHFCPLILVAGETITMLDGASRKISIVSINADGAITAASGKDFSFKDIRSIKRDVEPVSGSGFPILYLRHGGMIAAGTVVLDKGICRADWLVPITIPASAVSAIKLSSDKKGKDAFERARSNILEDDQIIALSDTGARVLKGVLLTLDKTHLELKYKDKVRKIALEKVYGIVLAGKLSTKKGTCRIYFTDNSWLQSNMVRLENGSLCFSLVDMKELCLPWKSVTRITVTSDRVAFLSDLEPLSVTQEAIVTFPGTWQRDKSVLGKEMRIGDQVFEKGIGVHSLCRLVFAPNGNYTAFAAVIGIDAETDGKGDCVFRVIADGKQLFEKQMRGSDKPVSVHVDIKDVMRLTLEVSPGNDLDLADHGNWGDARFLK